jgi:hypothetical protein
MEFKFAHAESLRSHLQLIDGTFYKLLSNLDFCIQVQH